MTRKTLRLVLGDQLSRNLSALDDLDVSSDTVVMMEVHDEGRYVPHHPKKIAFLLSAMRHFADALRDEGINVHYVALDSDESRGSLTQTLAGVVQHGNYDALVVTEPGEYRVLEMMQGWSDELDLPVEILDDTRFIATRQDFADWADGRKQLTLEYFYRELRKRTGALMDGKDPAGGKWNFDKDNRKPPKSGMTYRVPPTFKLDAITRDVIALVDEHFGDHFGDLEPFSWAVTAEGAEKAFAHFLSNALPTFGDYQDAMVQGEPFMFHSVISHYLNAGLLDARDVCQRAETEYREGRAPINAVEGFIRQILGWREFIRGVYWLKMPEYATRNALNATRPLPASYWGGDTKMNCIREVVAQTRENAYSHHIQRLMITGNFAL
ncbi:MAG: cryptochrome/photolyase family protein, partial [Pseudomonadota bacterium]